MYAYIDENVFIGKINPYDSIKSISISEFNENKLVNTYSWDIAPSSKTKGLFPYLHEAWEEIHPLIFNKTVVLYDANYTVSTIIRTFNYLINKTVPKTKPVERCFPELLQNLKAIKFDYICLSLICRRLFKDLPSNKINEICKYVNINFGSSSKEISISLGELFIYVSKIIECNTIIDIKHMAGITLGQLAKNISLKENKKQENQIIEYDKYYYPCLPITDTEIFRKFNLK